VDQRWTAGALAHIQLLRPSQDDHLRAGHAWTTQLPLSSDS
jgi:hypothetical protein